MVLNIFILANSEICHFTPELLLSDTTRTANLFPGLLQTHCTRAFVHFRRYPTTTLKWISSIGRKSSMTVMLRLVIVLLNFDLSYLVFQTLTYMEAAFDSFLKHLDRSYPLNFYRHDLTASYVQ